jgi:hypothetical protein
MLNIPGHKGNTSHSCSNGYHQVHKQQQMLAKMWGKRNPQTLLMKCKVGQPVWKTV